MAGTILHLEEPLGEIYSPWPVAGLSIIGFQWSAKLRREVFQLVYLLLGIGSLNFGCVRS